MRLLLFASGRGSNFEVILNAVKNKYISAKIAGLIVDRDCGAGEIAERNKIKVSKISPREYALTEDYEADLMALVNEYKPDFIILAGYMRIIPPSLIAEYPLRIINIHPSLLPSFKGMHAIEQAWKARVKITGVTVHYINDKLDEGLIIAQKPVQMQDSVSGLEEKIHEAEHELYVEVIKDLSSSYYDTVVVSSCLLGENCRYDGGNKYSGRVNKFISDFKGKVISICPELNAGFSVPRAKVDILKGRAISEEGEDVTERILQASKNISDIINSSKKVLAIMKEKSPSCGVNKTDGIFSNYLLNNFSSKLTIITEEEL